MNAPPPLFAGLALDRAEHLRDQPEALRALRRQARLILVDGSGRLGAVESGDALHLLHGEDPDGCWQEACFLGLRGDEAWFSRAVGDAEWAPPQWLDLRAAAARFDAFEAGVGAYARALALWQARTRFCSVCGGALTLARAGHVARCAACGAEHFPRTDPAVITLISHGDHVLLARQPGWPERRYSLIAGFVEPGESLEDAVAREAMEEVGLAVADCRYQASQPWPFPSSLMLGFTATAPLQAPRLGDEIEEAFWIDAAALRAAFASGELLPPFAISIARRLLDAWLSQRLDAPPRDAA
ncbi:MAG: NAD(+) diphosphatase [Xanthomonadaceae bacterium]|nr:NAD(+) diphosphatase [Xanthomonadaceae bacterium]